METAVDTWPSPDRGAGPRRDPSVEGGALGRLGPWRLQRVLGQGASGIVYLAEREPPGGGPVAVKVIHGHLVADPAHLARFLEEAERGRRVVHENVVRTLEVGTVLLAGREIPYLVMELVEGRTLRDLLLAWGALPETLLREVARQLAAGLAAIHASGLVHHDVKPENVILTQEHRVRLMDLGVARLFEGAGAPGDGRFAGTLLYAAPERFRREAVGPLADLYALGVLGYELATGTNPFQRVDAGAVMRAHLEWTPPPAAVVDPRVSPFLSEVLATLLEKRPERRFPSADVLGAVLAEGERGAWWRGREALAATHGARVPSILVSRDTLLQGRERELEALRAAWRDARRGEGRVILLEGEAGMGKTRLADAFLREAAPEAAHALYGTYAPTGGTGALSEALAGLFGETHLADRLVRLLPDLRDRIEAYVDVMCERNPGAAGGLPSLETLHAVTTRLLEALAAEGPLIWVIEDLHRAPGESLGLILSMARAVEGRRALVLLTTSPREEGPEAADLRSLPTVTSVPLRRLSASDVTALLREAFRSDALAEELGVRIATFSGGIPALALEAVRALRETGAVVQQPDGSWMAPRPVGRIGVSPAARDRIAARLAALGPSEREVLAGAAVAGVVFRPEQVARVLGRPALGVLDDLAKVERRHGLVRAGRDTCRFDPALVREVIYESLPEEVRRAHHAAFADLLEEGAGGDLADLVGHALAGGRDPTVRRFLDPALEGLVSTHRHDRAAALADAALAREGVLEGERRVDVLLLRAESLRMLGRRGEAQAALGDAVAEADALGSARCRVLARIQMGAQGYAIGAYPLAHQVLGEALRIAREAGEPLLEAAAAAEQGVVLRNLGRMAEAEALLTRALHLASSAGDVRLEARALGNLGVVHLYRGRYAEAEDLLLRQAALAARVGDDRLRAFAHMNLTAVAWETGRLDACETHATEHLALARAVGDRRLEAAATRNQGDVLRARGRREEARTQYGRSLGLARESGESSSEARTRLSLARLALAEGRLGEACAQARRARALAREIGSSWGDAHASVVVGQGLRLLGSREEAQEALAAARDAARALEDRPLEAEALSSLADVEADEGRAASGLRLADASLSIRRDLGSPGALARSLLQVGRLKGRTGDPDGARTAWEEGLLLARKGRLAERGLLAAHGVACGAASPDDARTALREDASRLEAPDLLAAWFALARATGEPADLREAEAVLDRLALHVAPDCRGSLEAEVPLHRSVREAVAAGGRPDAHS